MRTPATLFKHPRKRSIISKTAHGIIVRIVALAVLLDRFHDLRDFPGVFIMHAKVPLLFATILEHRPFFTGQRRRIVDLGPKEFVYIRLLAHNV